MPYILICRYSCTLVHEGLKKYNMCDILTYVPYGSNEGRLGVKKKGDWWANSPAPSWLQQKLHHHDPRRAAVS